MRYPWLARRNPGVQIDCGNRVVLHHVLANTQMPPKIGIEYLARGNSEQGSEEQCGEESADAEGMQH